MNKTDKKDRKNIFIQVRISQDEKTSIQNKSEECGLSVSDFIRQTTLDYRLRNNRQQKEALRNIARIASNLNQIARQANIYKDAVNKVQILVSLLEIETELKELRKCI